MRLPDIAEELRELAVVNSLPRLTELADEMKRRNRAVKAPPKSKKLTAAMKDDICAFKKANPNMTQFQIAEHFGVNQGRVSETLHGKRK
jgi:hypothetical protein